MLKALEAWLSQLPQESPASPGSPASPVGPNHRPGCPGSPWSYSGSGYNRVRLCHCGAEDHDPEAAPGAELARIRRELSRPRRPAARRPFFKKGELS